MVSGSGICAKRVVVDGRHHMLGRLAAVVAKDLLNGQPIAVVRAEQIAISGGLVRQKMKYMRFLRKRMNTQPSHGPIHYRSPAKIFWRTVRGVLRLQKGHKYCLLGQLSSEVGWNHYDTIKELENKRKERAQLAYERKKQLTKLRLKAEKSAEEKIGSQLELLSSVTY
ncbi:hypothetical protein C1H46_031017 [Malus baccata]|uniref:60S ribosomal protein L13a n=1 Tax=Malus baccata TaxID=106549 RepID=A0A540LAR0_MALBA|nr:hypothetical protein C1H46_031017 [Malus baccata]